MKPPFTIRRAEEGDRNEISWILKEFWGSTTILAKGDKYFGDTLPALVAVVENKIKGLLTYWIEDQCFLIVSLKQPGGKEGDRHCAD